MLNARMVAGIAPLMSQRIHDYFVALGFSEEEAWKTHVGVSHALSGVLS